MLEGSWGGLLVGAGLGPFGRSGRPVSKARMAGVGGVLGSVWEEGSHRTCWGVVGWGGSGAFWGVQGGQSRKQGWQVLEGCWGGSGGGCDGTCLGGLWVGGCVGGFGGCGEASLESTKVPLWRSLLRFVLSGLAQAASIATTAPMPKLSDAVPIPLSTCALESEAPDQTHHGNDSDSDESDSAHSAELGQGEDCEASGSEAAPEAAGVRCAKSKAGPKKPKAKLAAPKAAKAKAKSAKAKAKTSATAKTSKGKNKTEKKSDAPAGENQVGSRVSACGRIAAELMCFSTWLWASLSGKWNDAGLPQALS